jgi:small subunit ribosomal protein S24e
MTELKIESMKDNPLLKRKEIRYRISFENSATPSRDTIKELIARNTGANKELVVVDRNTQESGKHEVIGYSKIYADKESAMLYEPDYELFRNGLKVKEGAE